MNQTPTKHMKKFITVFACLSIPAALLADDGYYENMEKFRIISTILVLILFMVFIMTLIQRFMDYRVKNKIVEKGISEELANSILSSGPVENGNANFKWFTLLAGLGLGLTIIYYTQPLGIHSMAIMAFALSASFLGYYLFTRSLSKKD